MPRNDSPINNEQSHAVRTTVGEIADATQRHDESHTITRIRTGNPDNPTARTEYPVVNIEARHDASHTNSDIDDLVLADVSITPTIESNGDEKYYTGYKTVVKLFAHNHDNFPPFNGTWKDVFEWRTLGFTVTTATTQTDNDFNEKPSVLTAQTKTHTNENLPFRGAVVRSAAFMEALRSYRTRDGTFNIE